MNDDASVDELLWAYGPALLRQHAERLQASGIGPEIAAARGYRSVLKQSELRRLEFSDVQCRVPALLIPIRSVTGEIVLYQARPDEPRIVSGQSVPYETPRGARVTLDVPPRVRPLLSDPKEGLFITEGAHEADAAASRGICCVALIGLFSGRAAIETLSGWEQIVLNGREISIAFASDIMRKPAEHGAVCRLKAFLESQGARVLWIDLPAGEDGRKRGLDEFLASDHDVTDLGALATSELREPPVSHQEEAPYFAGAHGLVWLRPAGERIIPTPLTNFTAQIVANITVDDGAETRHVFEIEARLGGRQCRVRIPASQFSRMSWVAESLGARAILCSGFGLRDHARAAIQMLSEDIAERQVFTHLGWRRLEGRWVYLHAGGAIGSMGAVEGVEVALPESLKGFGLPAPAEGDDLASAIRASLRILDVVPDRVSVPLLGAIYRAVIGGTDFSLHLTGPTGMGKSELAALGQQHYGAGLDARHLPGTWISTGNALGSLAFAAKDALLVVDDFVPAATNDASRLDGEADRVLRSQGNHSGRQRLRADGSPRAARPPRGLILSTGEAVPKGVSLRARLLVLDLGPGELDWTKLTRAQADAAQGLYAQTLAGFVRWLSPRLDELWAGLKSETQRWRQAATGNHHKRTPQIVANLAMGLRTFLDYGRAAGAIDVRDQGRLWGRFWAALGEAAERQARPQHCSEPAGRFVELLCAAFASGRAHVASPDGGEPESPEAWGWRHGCDGFKPQGVRIGWRQGEDLYLEPHSSYAVAQDLAREAGSAIGLSAKTLHKRLHESGFLASTDKERRTLTVRRSLEGERRAVLHLRASSVSPEEPAQPAQRDSRP